MQEQLIELKSDSRLKELFTSCPLSSFWAALMREYPQICDVAFKILLPFTSTYLCEAGFSKMTALKTKYRNRAQIENDLRLCLSDIEPRIDDLCKAKQTQDQVQGQRDVSSFGDFVDKLILNFSKRFDSFRFGQQLTLFIQNPFLITDVSGFSKEVTQHFKWANAGPLQMQLIDLQADVALKEQFGITDPATFWLQMVSETAFPAAEAAFSAMNIIKSKYRSRLTNEHLHMCMRMALTTIPA
ncbi:Zinc finger BED domain-containing protein 5 [Merluccius polli]|uniref:Zinc finger BED domain-containing protein 5 n=1 Tax=Merluccius polli TaxID=89951 RepID=A0AA47NB47_MERPO|nr:Zinc finger BED domain-containing protein 5 [Merluccius polli]